MNLWSLSYEKVEELKKQETDKQTEYEKLFVKDIETIWLEELDELLEAYNVWYENKKLEYNDSTKIKKAKGRKK